MPKTPKEKPETDIASASEDSAWGEDHKKREYYYDDAHGYEIYVALDSDEESDDGEAA